MTQITVTMAAKDFLLRVNQREGHRYWAYVNEVYPHLKQGDEVDFMCGSELIQSAVIATIMTREEAEHMRYYPPCSMLNDRVMFWLPREASPRPFTIGMFFDALCNVPNNLPMKRWDDTLQEWVGITEIKVEVEPTPLKVDRAIGKSKLTAVHLK